jgi:hypothetical protein
MPIDRGDGRFALRHNPICAYQFNCQVCGKNELVGYEYGAPIMPSEAYAWVERLGWLKHPRLGWIHKSCNERLPCSTKS